MQISRNTYRIPIVTLILCLASTGALGSAAPVPEGVRYYTFKINGQKIGYSIESIEHQADGTIFTQRESYQKLKRFGSLLELKISSQMILDAKLEPTWYNNATTINGQTTRIKGTRQGDKFLFEVTLAGKTTKEELTLPSEFMLADFAPYKLVKNGWPKGKKKRIKLFIPSERRVFDATLEITGEKEVQYPEGGSCRAEIVHSDVSFISGDDFLCKDTGIMVRSELPMMSLVTELTTKDDALKKFEAGSWLFGSTLKVLNKNLDPINELVKVRWMIEGKGLTEPMETSRQKLIGTGNNGKIVLEVSRQEPPSHKASIPIEPVPDSVAKYLKPTELIQSDDPRISSLALKAVNGTKDAWEAVKKLLVFTDRYIKNKTMDEGYLSALEVMEEKRGDCTEHSLFFTALARSLGIPARPIMGLAHVVYNGRGILIGHQWAQVYMGEKNGWIEVDPTIGQDLARASHLALALGTGSGRDKFEYTGKVMGIMMHGRFKVLSAQWKDGTKWRSSSANKKTK